MHKDNLFPCLAMALYLANADKDMSWENINRHFAFFTPDRRYKVWFGCNTNGIDGIWFLGNPDRNGKKCLVRYINGYIYVRPVNDDLYTEKPCYEVRPCGKAFGRYWQNETLI